MQHLPSGHFISVWRLSPREEVQALPVVGASHKHGVALCRADAAPMPLASAPSAWDALVQRQAQESALYSRPCPGFCTLYW